MDDTIDWTALRQCIASRPIAVRPKYVRHVNRSPESIERRRTQSREWWKEHYAANPSLYKAKQRLWEKENPDKVKIKRKRYYDLHKDDSEWMARHRQKNREYKQRQQFKKYCVSLMINVLFLH